jgi:hypothetical protein
VLLPANVIRNRPGKRPTGRLRRPRRPNQGEQHSTGDDDASGIECATLSGNCIYGHELPGAVIVPEEFAICG